MYTKEQVISKLDQFKAYSISQKSNFNTYYTNLLAPLYSAVNTYFNGDRSSFKKPLEDLVLYSYNDIWQRTVKFENEFDMGFKTDYPIGFNDWSDMFYNFDVIMNTSNATFFNAWVEELPTTPGATTSIPTKNTLIDSWVASLSTAQQNELDNITAHSKWVEDDLGQSGMISLLEDQGSILYCKQQDEIANIIYIDRKLLEIINIFNLNVYIPTYLK